MPHQMQGSTNGARVSSEVLTLTAQYLVDATQQAWVSPDDRPQKLRWLGRVLLAMRAPPTLLVGAFCLRELIRLRPARVRWIGRVIMEDHASRPVQASIKRVDKGSVWPASTWAPGWLRLAASIRRNLVVMAEAYRLSRPATPFDQTRVLRLLASYAYWHCVFEYRLPSAAYIAITNDQRRLALGVVAQEWGVPLVAWSVQRQGTRLEVPFKIAAQLCWSRTQRLHLENQGIPAFQVPVETRPMKTLDMSALRNGALGFLLNARVDVVRLRALLQQLRDVYGIRDIQVRPHPGALLKPEDWQGLAVLRDWREPLAAYLESINAAICMTSGVMFDALLHGVPIAYRAGLDDVKHDATGLVRNRVIAELKLDHDPLQALLEQYGEGRVSAAVIHDEYSSDTQPEREALERYAP